MLDVGSCFASARMSAPVRPTRQLLLIESDPELAAILSTSFGAENFEVEHRSELFPAFARLAGERWDIVVLGAAPPETAIFELCRRLRGEGCEAPVIMLGPADTLAHRVLGFEAGADEYLAKPISTLELMARIRSILRRVEGRRRAEEAPGGTLRVGGVEVDMEAREVRIDGATKRLTTKEFDLLRVLASRPERAFTRAELLDEVWGYRHEGYEHTVNTHVNRLRAKIERDPARPVRLVTVRGVGYKLKRQ